MGLQRVRHDWAIELNWIETGDSKSEHWHFRNQCTKMEQNEWIQFRWPLYLLWTRIPFKKWKSLHSQEKSLKCNTWMQSQKQQNGLCSFPTQTIQYHSNPSQCPNQECWRSSSWMVLWRPIRPSRTNSPKRCPFHYRGLKCKSRSSRDTWSNRQIRPWSTEWSSKV